jgi:hypothetical protein
VSESVSQSVSPSFSQSVSQSVIQSVSQSVSQSVNCQLGNDQHYCSINVPGQQEILDISVFAVDTLQHLEKNLD